MLVEELTLNATLSQLQSYVRGLEAERGFASQTAIEKSLLLGEEVGELFKAVRKQEGLPIDAGGAAPAIADELADILIYVCAIANRYQVDLEDAFRRKERVNATRFWAVQPGS
jgi:NTP pyrophosphatase (non-canonical NTP hydrolase)